MAFRVSCENDIKIDATKKQEEWETETFSGLENKINSLISKPYKHFIETKK